MKFHTRTIRYFILSVIVLLSTMLLTAQPTLRDTTPQQQPLAGDSLSVSLITCYPGPEVYELYGHEAIRVKGNGIDSVWNYGMFSFDQPYFVYRFVKGKTDYFVLGYPFEYFLPQYIHRGSKVVEQDLNLSQAEARQVLKMLQINALPQNRMYRYNYVKDNCATRIYNILEKSTGENFVLRDSLNYASYRKEMTAFAKNYPWYQFGVDLALGSGIDYPISKREELFVPVVMMQNLEKAERLDGRPLIKSQRELYEGRGDVTLSPTPWYLTPLFVMIILLLVSIIFSIHDLRKRQVSRWWYALFYGILGITGCIISFLVFFSEHEATSSNILVFWLNPLQLLVPIFIFNRHTRILSTIVIWCDILVTSALLIIWAMQPQSTNPAVFPWIGATLVLSITYAIISTKSSYNNKLADNNRQKSNKTPTPRKRKTAKKTVKQK